MVEITEEEISHRNAMMRELVSKIKERYKYVLYIHNARDQVLSQEYSCNTMYEFYIKYCGGIIKQSQTIYKRIEQ